MSSSTTNKENKVDELLFTFRDIKIKEIIESIDRSSLIANEVIEQSRHIDTVSKVIKTHGCSDALLELSSDIVTYLTNRPYVCEGLESSLDSKPDFNDKDIFVAGVESATDDWITRMISFFKWLGKKLKELFDGLSDGALVLIARAEILLRNLRSRRVIKSGNEAFQSIRMEDLEKEVFTLTKTEYRELEYILREKFNTIRLVENFIRDGGPLDSMMVNSEVKLTKEVYEDAIRKATQDGVVIVTRNMHSHDISTRKMLSIIQPESGAKKYKVRVTEWENEMPLISAVVSCQNYAKQLLQALKVRSRMDAFNKESLRQLEAFRRLSPKDRDSDMNKRRKQVIQNMVNGSSNTLIVLSSLIFQIRKIISFVLSKISNLEVFLARHRS